MNPNAMSTKKRLDSPISYDSTEPTADKTGTTLINHWQCGVPVTTGPVLTPFILMLTGIAATGLGLAALRLFFSARSILGDE